MLNIEKIKHMTKAAAYENGVEKKNIKISSYFRTDYLGLQMVKSALAYTAAYAIVLAIWVMGIMEELLGMLTKMEIINSLIKELIIFYVAGLVAYEIAIYAYYSIKYEKAKKSVKGFQIQLKHIHKFYETQETADTILNLDEEADEGTTR